MGFDGLLMCDDLSMNALSGDFSHRTQSAFAAGCDVVLHCNGLLEEMAEVADALPRLEGIAKQRAQKAMERLHFADNSSEQELRNEFCALCDLSKSKMK